MIVSNLFINQLTVVKTFVYYIILFCMFQTILGDAIVSICFHDDKLTFKRVMRLNFITEFYH